MHKFWLSAAVFAALLSGTAFSAPLYQPGVQVGTITDSQIVEASGLAASRLNSGILWTHNDSGDSARIFAISTSGSLRGTFGLNSITATDFEDIAVGRGPVAGISYVYVSDIGDNNEIRADIRIHRLAEPTVGLSGSPISANVNVDTITLVYPNAEKHNAETLMIDPLSGDLYIVTKQASIARVYRTPAPQSGSSSATLEFITQLTSLDKATAGDISPDGSAIVIRNTGTTAWQWTRGPGDSIAAALATTRAGITLQNESQGEALGFSAFGTPGFYTTSEGTNQPIYFYAAVPEPIGLGLACLAIPLLVLRRHRR